MSWTDERVELLRKLWGAGKTAAEIAQELGDVTRNAVIGKAHRLKLAGRVSPIQQNTKKPARTEKPKVAKPKAPAEVIAEKAVRAIPADQISKDGGVEMADLKDRMCRWPLGDPRKPGFRFCGHEAAPGMPYCEAHVQAAYQPAGRTRVLQEKELANLDKDVKKVAGN